MSGLCQVLPPGSGRLESGLNGPGCLILSLCRGHGGRWCVIPLDSASEKPSPRLSGITRQRHRHRDDDDDDDDDDD